MVLERLFALTVPHILIFEHYESAIDEWTGPPVGNDCELETLRYPRSQPRPAGGRRGAAAGRLHGTVGRRSRNGARAGPQTRGCCRPTVGTIPRRLVP